MDFKSLEGKKIYVYDYFDTLTQLLDWKYDREESDLFYRLSKTFWREGIKVSLILKEYCCVPPQGEETTIQSIKFFSFDKKKYKEKNVYSHFEEISKNKQYFKFENAEQYIAHLESDYPYIIPYSDFNTKDVNLLQRIELIDVPIAIQKDVWDDLCLCEM